MHNERDPGASVQEAHETRMGTGVQAGLAAFISMAYIISVKPQTAGAIPPFLNSVRP